MDKIDPDQWLLTIKDSDLLCGACKTVLIGEPIKGWNLNTYMEGIRNAVIEHLKTCPRAGGMPEGERWETVSMAQTTMPQTD